MTDQEIEAIAEKVAAKINISLKEMMTIKELVALGYPEKMLRELSHASYARSVVKRRGQGSTIYFLKPKLAADIERWQARH